MSERTVASLQLRAEDLEHVEAGADFSPAASHYDATVFGTVGLVVDGEVTHGNYLPATMDVLDTARAQYELVRAVERDGEYDDVPFCCTCGNRGCTYVRWDVSTPTSDGLRLEVVDLSGTEVGDSPYDVPRTVLYRAARDLVAGVVEFCEARSLSAFDWAEWRSPSTDAREHYATLDELRGWRADLTAALEAVGGEA